MGEFHSTKDIYDERLQILNLKTLEWREAVATGPKPCGRRSHSAWAYGGRMYTFGGYQGTINKHFNDLHCYDPNTGSWEVVVPTGEFPSPRRRQCTVVIDQKLYLFGGTMPIGVTANNSASGLADLDDLHVLDFQPSLETLAMQQLIKLKDPRTAYYLPPVLWTQYENMTKPNTISPGHSATRMDLFG